MQLITLITVIVGFLGLIIMMLQLHNQVRIEVRGSMKELKSDLKSLKDDLKSDIARLNNEIRDLRQELRLTNIRIDGLYRELFKKGQDAA